MKPDLFAYGTVSSLDRQIDILVRLLSMMACVFLMYTTLYVLDASVE